jgi:cyanophycinase
MTRSFGLMGSGEFDPWTEEVDRWLLARSNRVGPVLILPAASAPEGDEVFDGWATKGLAHYARLGIPAEVVPIKTPEDANERSFADKLRDSPMAFFSGGNPAYLAKVLAGSKFWTALLDEMERGLAYGGCSAGIACLGDLAPDSGISDLTSPEIWQPGLSLFPKVFFGPHWDALNMYMPGLQALFVAAVPADSRLLAIDENTAVVGDGAEWKVIGAGGAYLLDAGDWTESRSGSTFTAPLLVSEAASA